MKKTSGTKGAAKDIEEMLCCGVAKALALPVETIDPYAPLERWELDSVEVMYLAGQVEKRLGRPVEPSILWGKMSLRALARELTRA
ncbi:MAG: acyl carrier protein [Elusimicrobiota bacterium]|jgi:polyketide synthase 12